MIALREINIIKLFNRSINKKFSENYLFEDYYLKSGIPIWVLVLRTSGETVEKVPKQILRGDAEKNDFTECATINDLTIMKGRETPKN